MSDRFLLEQKVRPIAPGFFDRCCAPPLGDLGVIAADENLWDGPSAIFRGPRVMRKVQKNLTRYS